MKCFLLIILNILFIFSSCKRDSKAELEEKEILTPPASGKKLFEGKGNCIACHLESKKGIGPSINDIASVYKIKKGDIVAFLKGEADPIVDPSQYAVMKTNFAVTKQMSEKELKDLEAYIYSNLK